MKLLAPYLLFICSFSFFSLWLRLRRYRKARRIMQRRVSTNIRVLVRKKKKTGIEPSIHQRQALHGEQGYYE